MFWRNQKTSYICTRNKHGTLAQLVEQWTENPCVPGSNPGGTTKPTKKLVGFLFVNMSRPEIAIHKKYPYGKT